MSGDLCDVLLSELVLPRLLATGVNPPEAPEPAPAPPPAPLGVDGEGGPSRFREEPFRTREEEPSSLLVVRERFEALKARPFGCPDTAM